MRERPEDFDRLQGLLDTSHATAGSHLAEVHPDKVRLTARDLAARLDGMRVFVVATVSSDHRPLSGPVDAFLVRGRICFGTAANALKARHLARNPAISATYVEGEGLVFSVHGTAQQIEVASDDDLRGVLLAQYGQEWLATYGSSPYFAIDARRCFAADMTRHLVP